MILAVMALGASLITWGPKESAQIGVMMGRGVDQHLIFLVPETGCKDGMRVFSGYYGDFDKSAELLKTSHICTLVEKRAVMFKAILAKAKAKEEAR